MSDPVELPPQRVAELLREADPQLVDVRTPDEHAAGSIAGDVHIELEELPAQAQSLERERPVVFYCRSGARSALATGAFRQAGYEAYNLDGGLRAWVAAGLPLVPEDGRVAAH